MRRLLAIFLLAISALALTACASAFQRPPENADYGSPPVGYEDSIRNYFEPRLKDPESARFKFSRPIKAYANNGLVYGGDVGWKGYMVDVQVNAKNSFGGYVGFKPYMVFFNGNAIHQTEKGSSHPLVHRME